MLRVAAGSLARDDLRDEEHNRQDDDCWEARRKNAGA
jgi:hypothetical protein